MKSSSSSSFDYGPKLAAFGCLSGLLRRFLSGCLCKQTYSGGSEVNLGREHKGEQKPLQSSSIVAQLMGLDSMPVEGSCSMNSIDSERRSAVSFRESSTYLRQENEEFLVLSFSPDDKGAKKATRRKENIENKSQNSSPTSVLDHPNVGDFEFFVVEPSSPLSGNASIAHQVAAPAPKCRNVPQVLNSQDGEEQQSSRRKLSSHFENCYFSPPRTLEETTCRDEGMQSIGDRRKLYSTWEDICRLVENDLKRSKWVSREIWRSEEEAEDIAAEIGMEIFDDLLLCEATSELSNYITKL